MTAQRLITGLAALALVGAAFPAFAGGASSSSSVSTSTGSSGGSSGGSSSGVTVQSGPGGTRITTQDGRVIDCPPGTSASVTTSGRDRAAATDSTRRDGQHADSRVTNYECRTDGARDNSGASSTTTAPGGIGSSVTVGPGGELRGSTTINPR